MNDDDAIARRSEARRWWVIAAEDMRVAEACLALDPPSCSNAAYHCQQAAEKIMKGVLIERGVNFRRVHDLDELAGVVAIHRGDLEAELDACRTWSAWAIDYRYPGDDPPVLPRADELAAALETLRHLLVVVAFARE